MSFLSLSDIFLGRYDDILMYLNFFSLQRQLIICTEVTMHQSLKTDIINKIKGKLNKEHNRFCSLVDSVNVERINLLRSFSQETK